MKIFHTRLIFLRFIFSELRGISNNMEKMSDVWRNDILILRFEGNFR